VATVAEVNNIKISIADFKTIDANLSPCILPLFVFDNRKWDKLSEIMNFIS